jgi:quercetin dioxygenase-like cupin family protein
MTADVLQLSPAQRLTVVEASDERLVLEAHWLPSGGRPPVHRHPEHDEHFTVLSGRLGVQIDGEDRELGPGDELAVGRGARHAMWNAGDGPAEARWVSSPGTRPLAFFRAVDAAWRATPDGSGLGEVAAAHTDVIRFD